MSKKKKKINKVGRPRYKFTKAQIEEIGELAGLGCHTETIANKIGCEPETIVNNFSGFLHKKRSEHRIDIRKAQKKQLNTPAVAIFLGKNDLGQADKKEITGRDGAPLLPLQLIVQPQEAKNDDM